MKRSCIRVAELGAVLLLVACASARVIPKDNGEYVAIGRSHSEAGATDAAIDEGQNTCKKLGKSFVMVNEKSQYRDDNRVEITFKCK